jgi:uncharacterized membrane protein
MHSHAFWQSFTNIGAALAVAAVCALIAALATSVLRPFASAETQNYAPHGRAYFLHAVPVALLAYTAGFMSGSSRVSVIGNLLAAIFAVMGGLNIYVFGTDSKNKLIVGYCISVFAVAVLIGLQQGSTERYAGLERHMTYLSDLEGKIALYRKNLGIHERPADWLPLPASK